MIEGRGVGESGLGVYLDFGAAIERYGKQAAKVQGIANASKEKIRELGEAVSPHGWVAAAGAQLETPLPAA